MTDLKVANTILEQLGGRRFVLMTGAKRFTGTENALSFTAARKAYRITLDASDTYTVRQTTFAGRVLREESLVYADQLQRTIRRFSGLEVSMRLEGNAVRVSEAVR